AAVVVANDTDSAARPHAAATAMRALPSIMARRYRLPGPLSMVVAPPSSPRLPLTSGRQSGCQDDHRRPACMLPRGGTALRTSNVSVGEGARLSDVELAAWFALLRTHALVARRLDSMLQERHRLSLVEHTVLHLLRAAGGRMRMSELAGSALLSPSGVSRLADRLVAAGHIERTAWRHGGRAIQAVITGSGPQGV